MMDEKNKNNGINVYEKVYSILLNLENKKIRPFELYSIIENMKFGRGEVIETIRDVLKEAGFNDSYIERISNNLSWKLRFTRADSREIEKKLCKKGLICRERNYIIIN